MKKPVLVAETNPYSKDPGQALFPRPMWSTGSRVYRMLNSRTGVGQEEYLQSFDRRNYFDEDLDARTFVQSIPAGSTVVLMGEKVRQALHPVLKLPKTFLIPVMSVGRVWRQVPHPSGRCRFYNDPIMRELVAMLLEDLYKGEC